MARGNYTRKFVIPREAEADSASISTAARMTHRVSIVDRDDGSVKAESRFFSSIADRRHIPWLSPLLLCCVIVVIGTLVLVFAGIAQRPGSPQLVHLQGGEVYPIQIGGSITAINTWQQSNKPIFSKIPLHSGPYSVLGNPTLSVDFMNKVLASYHSPAAGKAQTLYDYGIKYEIDPAFALAFFLHESTLGTAGEATVTLSLGNLRCIPSVPCHDGYAQFASWEQGFEAWYKLIRNLYVAQWGLVSVDQIIPKYAPNSDHNNEAGYIASLKHTLDVWHANILRP